MTWTTLEKNERRTGTGIGYYFPPLPVSWPQYHVLLYLLYLCFVAFTTSPLHLALLPATDQPHSGHHCVVHFIQIKLLLPKDIAPKLHMCRPLSSREDGHRCDGCNTRVTTPSETSSSGRWQLLSPATACVCWTRPAPYKQDAPSTAAL